MDLSVYPPAIRPLLTADRVPELGPGQPNPAVRSALEALTAEALFGGKPIERRDLAQCCLAGLWLLHDFLDESHKISQDIASAEGSYWHGILHWLKNDVFSGISCALHCISARHRRIMGMDSNSPPLRPSPWRGIRPSGSASRLTSGTPPSTASR